VGLRKALNSYQDQLQSEMADSPPCTGVDRTGPRLRKRSAPSHIFQTSALHLASWRWLKCQFVINMASSLEPEDESSGGWALDDSDDDDDDAAYVDKPTVRSQLMHL